MARSFSIVLLIALLTGCDSEDRSNVERGIVTGVAAGVASSIAHHAIAHGINKFKERRAQGRGFSFRRR